MNRLAWGTIFTFSQLVSIGLLITGVGAMYYFSQRGKLTGRIPKACNNLLAPKVYPFEQSF